MMLPRGSWRGAPIAESTEMFEMDQEPKGEIAGAILVSRASAQKIFNMLARLLVNMMAKCLITRRPLK